MTKNYTKKTKIILWYRYLRQKKKYDMLNIKNKGHIITEEENIQTDMDDISNN